MASLIAIQTWDKLNTRVNTAYSTSWEHDEEHDYLACNTQSCCKIGTLYTNKFTAHLQAYPPGILACANKITETSEITMSN